MNLSLFMRRHYVKRNKIREEIAGKIGDNNEVYDTIHTLKPMSNLGTFFFFQIAVFFSCLCCFGSSLAVCLSLALGRSRYSSFHNLHLSPWESTVPTCGPFWAIVAKTIIFWYLKTIIFWYLKA